MIWSVAKTLEKCFYCCLTYFCYLIKCIMQHFYFFLTSEMIWNVDNDIFGGLVISKFYFNGEEYFEKVLFLISYSLYLELELIRNQCI